MIQTLFATIFSLLFTHGSFAFSAECTSLREAPTESHEISNFIQDVALALRSGDKEMNWNFQPLIEAFGSHKVFMFGEAHGSNEFGIVSARLLESLVKSQRINVIALEAPMDYAKEMQHYVDTGEGDPAKFYMEFRIGEIPQNSFWVILPRMARQLTLQGFRLRIHPTDNPFRTEPALKEIKSLAAQMTPAHSAFLLGILPPPTTATSATPEDGKKADDFYNQVHAQKAQLCADLIQTQCDRLLAQTSAIWVSTKSMLVRGLDAEWVRRREELTYANVRALMTKPEDRLYMHVGAFHTNKLPRTIRGLKTISGMLENDFPLTRGQVFTLAPAFGAGSVSATNWSTFPPKDFTWKSGMPTPIVKALSETPSHPLFISAVQPSSECQTNPLKTMIDKITAKEFATEEKPLGEMYDGFIHFGRLTSDRRPGDTKL